MFTGRPVNGEEAGNIGLVDCSVEQNETMDAAYQRALKLADEILPNGPIALRMVKQAINRGSEVLQFRYNFTLFLALISIDTKDVQRKCQPFLFLQGGLIHFFVEEFIGKE